MESTFGKIVLFGSGETSSTGRAIHRKVFQSLGKTKQHVAILETPAGFQLNSALVARDVAQMFRESLGEFVQDVVVIPAQKKGTEFSPDNPKILTALEFSDVIFLGPGSPTYALRQLKDSLAWKLIVRRWKQGVTLSLASAATLAIGKHTLPVYEIYKVGTDFYWENGLNHFAMFDMPITIVGHWNNEEGGKNVDTSRCFMGKTRFLELRKLLTRDEVILGIDEHTAVVLDPNSKSFTVEGKGEATVLLGGKEEHFIPGSTYDLRSIMTAKKIEREKREIKMKGKQKDVSVDVKTLPENIQRIIQERELARSLRNFHESDELRKDLQSFGYTARDTDNGQLIFVSSGPDTNELLPERRIGQ